MISYYDLITMIHKNNIPERIRYYSPGDSNGNIYIAHYDLTTKDFSCYILIPDIEHLEKITEPYKFYLLDNFLDSDLFRHCIEIIKEN